MTGVWLDPYYRTKSEKIATQRVFTEAYKHVVAQQRAASDSFGTCVYRRSINEQKRDAAASGMTVPEGSLKVLGCAFSPCIEKYVSRMEGSQAPEMLTHWSAYLHSWARECDPEVARLIQAAHDKQGSDFIPLFKGRMSDIATTYDLKVPE